MELKAQLMQEMETQQDYSFKTDQLTYSSVDMKGIKKSYVTGYISVPEVDLYNDLVTPTALRSMLKQISEKSITLDYEHEAWRDDNTILPVGKIVEAKVDDRGLWVKAELNPHSPKYKSLWGSIKDGFINAFSIAFKPLKVVTKTMGNTVVRLIEDLTLLNVALTATPVNAGAKMTGHNMKSVMLKAIDDTTEEKVLITRSLLTKLMEEKSMGETEIKSESNKMDEETKEDKACVKKSDDKEEEVVETKEDEESDDKESVEQKALAEMTKNLEKLQKENSEIMAELKSLKNSPVFKSTVSENKPVMKSEPINMLSLIR